MSIDVTELAIDAQVLDGAVKPLQAAIEEDVIRFMVAMTREFTPAAGGDAAKIGDKALPRIPPKFPKREGFR